MYVYRFMQRKKNTAMQVKQIDRYPPPRKGRLLSSTISQQQVPPPPTALTAAQPHKSDPHPRPHPQTHTTAHRTAQRHRLPARASDVFPSRDDIVAAATQVRGEGGRLVERLMLVRVRRGEQALALLLVRLRCSGGGSLARAGEAREGGDEVVK